MTEDTVHKADQFNIDQGDDSIISEGDVIKHRRCLYI